MTIPYDELPDDDLPGMWERADFMGGKTDNEVIEGQVPRMNHLNENNPCGPTDDNAICKCGCTGYDERCAYYIATYAFTDQQVRPEHTCCQIPGREENMAKAISPMVSMIADESEDHEPRVLDTAVLRLMAEEVNDCNVAKGWHEVNPRVEKFMEWFRETYPVLVAALAGDVSRVQEKAEEMFGPRSFGDDIALLHSEVSEMLEAFRDHGTEDQTNEVAVPVHCQDPQCGDSTWDHDCGEGFRMEPGKPEGVGSEAADVLVRLLDTCHRYDIDLFAEWRRKVNFNWTRPARHGGKRL